MIGFKDYKVPDKVDIVLPHPTISIDKTQMYKDEAVALIKSFKSNMNKYEKREWHNRLIELIDQLS